ncbi:MAG: lipopolysaccharide kinase InaA family protein [Desulfobacterium sp.]|nr:lipopolysaccharide kinase InaA family protein [Desulfobacterium sp.]
MSDTMLELLNDPDSFLNHSSTEIIQNNFKSKVGIVNMDDRQLVIKRHNYKSQWHKFRRYFRPTRASRNWHYSNLLQSRGILVPTPVGFVEQRIGSLRGMSHFVYEYVEGISGETYFKHHLDCPEKVDQGMNMVVSLVLKIKNLGLIHGDIRMSNLIFKDNKLWLLDFDDMRKRSWYKMQSTKDRDIRGLRKDIFYNIPPALQNDFLDRLASF